MPRLAAQTRDVQSGGLKREGFRVVHSVCTLDCPDTCGVLVTVDEATGRAVKVAGDPAHPVTRGFLCGKVAKFLDRVYSPERVVYPMRRRPGIPRGAAGRKDFERISWDEALGEIADRLARISAEFGPEAILPYSYAGTIGQLGYGSMDRRFFYRLGASQLDRTICAAAGIAAMNSVYGTRLGTAPADFADAGMVLCWGANVHGNNIHLWPFIEQARRDGAALVVIDPYRTRTAAAASGELDAYLAIHPGTDTALALGLMHVIVREGLEDRAYIDRCTAGFAELRAHVLEPRHAPDAVSAITGIPAAAIIKLALDYGRCFERTGKPAVIRVNYGIQRSEGGGTAARAVLMLPLITGAWGYRGGGALLSLSGAFPFNAATLQRPELMLRSPLGRAARMVNMNRLGSALTELGLETGAGVDEGFAPGKAGPPVKALFVYNSNPAVVAPNQTAVLRGLMRPDLFTVVHEQTFTDTASYADIVLPAPTFIEQKELVGAYGHTYVQIAQPAIAPVGEARSNVELFSALARRMGFASEDESGSAPGDGGSGFDDTADDLIDQALGSERTPHPWFAGVTRERLEQEGHVRLSLPVNGAGETLPFSTPEWFGTASGRGEFTPVPVFTAPRESRGGDVGEFPLEFLSRKNDSYMNSTFASHESHRMMEARLTGLEPATLEMHRADAAARGIADGDPVRVWNARGAIELTAALSDRIQAGVVAGRLDVALRVFGDSSRDSAKSNVNALTSETLTDLGGGATFYSVLVEVSKR